MNLHLRGKEHRVALCQCREERLYEISHLASQSEVDKLTTSSLKTLLSSISVPFFFGALHILPAIYLETMTKPVSYQTDGHRH